MCFCPNNLGLMRLYFPVTCPRIDLQNLCEPIAPWVHAEISRGYASYWILNSDRRVRDRTAEFSLKTDA